MDYTDPRRGIINPNGTPVLMDRAIHHIRANATFGGPDLSLIGDFGLVVKFTLTPELRELDTWGFRNLPDGKDYWLIVVYTPAGTIRMSACGFFDSYQEAAARAAG